MKGERRKEQATKSLAVYFLDPAATTQTEEFLHPHTSSLPSLFPRLQLVSRGAVNRVEVSLDSVVEYFAYSFAGVGTAFHVPYGTDSLSNFFSLDNPYQYDGACLM